MVDVPLTRASAAGIGGSDLSVEHGGQVSSFVYFKRDLAKSRVDLLFEQCLRNAVRRAGTGTEEEGSKDCRKVEGAVDCTEIVLRRLGFESMLMKCRQEPLS